MHGAKAPITIGMPVYNAEALIDNAIRSVLRQTYADFRVVISDNASTDGTSEICARHARDDPRVTYIRQSENIGAEANFDLLLTEARSKYFMWAAADDTRSDDFLALNIAFLDAHPDFVASTCPVRFQGGTPDPLVMGDATRAEATAEQRIARFFDGWHANGRYYSLFRRDALSFWPGMRKDYLGSDWAFSVEMLRRGKMNRVEEGFVELGREGFSHSLGIFARYRKSWLHWIVPFHELRRHVLALLPSSPEKAEVRRKLFHLNVAAARLQLRYELERRRQARVRGGHLGFYRRGAA
jgi:glycosyltransferase involved in cell wall biosynthesis